MKLDNMTLLESFNENYNEFLESGDPYFHQWLLIYSPIPTLCIVTTYILIVIYGPKLMESRKPFDLKRIMMLYNWLLTAVNLFIAYQVAKTVNRLNYSWIDEQPHLVESADHRKLAFYYYLFFIMKLVELGDTVFFILRQKSKQLSGLHIYHHIMVPTIGWMLMKIHPSGMAFLVVFVNACIHVIMYSYYGLSTIGPWMKKYLWWKKYLTQLQLVQFVFGVSMYLNYTCVKGHKVPNVIQYIAFPYLVSLIYLFGKFYILEYRNKMVVDRKIK